MKKPLATIALLITCAASLHAQSYTSSFIGDTSDVITAPKGGICLMGGATESDEAMRWFLQQANGGDVVVIRTAGTNAYNSYMYSLPGVSVNSVQTIIFNNASAANDLYVRRQLRNAEAVWIAGGDQSAYVQTWKGTPVDSILNWLVNARKVPVGGTSAGMMILGDTYFSAQISSVTSATALANPYDAGVTLGTGDFLRIPILKKTITDTHYDNPDRRGRQMVFLSRMMSGNGDTARGIACDEYTAVCVDTAGNARVYGHAPQFDDNAYFLQVNCAGPNMPENRIAGQPLNWVRGNAAVKVYHAKGDTAGTQTFNLKTWKSGSGGAWEHWWVANGTLMTGAGSAPACAAGITQIVAQKAMIDYFPNPGTSHLDLRNNDIKEALVAIYSATGQVMLKKLFGPGTVSIDTQSWPAGIYTIASSGGYGLSGKAFLWTKD